MSYLVMEIHPAYAVLMDEEGRFLKAANLRYQVGDRVGDIIEMRESKSDHRALRRSLAGLATLAACFCLAFFGYFQPNFSAYGTLRIQINPDVELTISRTERVLALEGLNEDGKTLIAGYDYQGKTRNTATGELVERAIDMGYLSGGDTISITVNSADEAWRTRETQQVHRQLEERYGETIVIRLGGPEDGDGDTSADSRAEVSIPAGPQQPSQSQKPYGDTDYGPSGGTDDHDTDYGPNADGITDYDDTDYGPNNDGVTGYSAYGNSVTDYGARSDGSGDDNDNDDDGNDDEASDDTDDGDHDDDDDD